MNIQDRFFDLLPVRRKSYVDWAVPLFGVCVGIGIGIGVGLLVAPEPGENARTRLRERASRIRERAHGLAEKAGRAVTEELEHPIHS